MMRYDSNLKGYNNIVLVGINYDKDGKIPKACSVLQENVTIGICISDNKI